MIITPKPLIWPKLGLRSKNETKQIHMHKIEPDPHLTTNFGVKNIFICIFLFVVHPSV